MQTHPQQGARGLWVLVRWVVAGTGRWSGTFAKTTADGGGGSVHIYLY